MCTAAVDVNAMSSSATVINEMNGLLITGII